MAQTPDQSRVKMEAAKVNKSVMIRKLMAVLVFCTSTALTLTAQSIPPEWILYTSSGYISDFQCDYNTKELPETDFKQYLLSVARSNLAKQVQVSVKEQAVLEKLSVNGHTSINYSSTSVFSTDVALKLVETKTMYIPSTKEGFAIAYIDKSAGIRYWSNELNIVLGSIESCCKVAQAYISTGFKDKAKLELQKAEGMFSSADTPLFWIAFLGMSDLELQNFMARRNLLEETVKKSLSDLQYGTTICIKCSADIFGTANPKLSNDIKGKLAPKGCNFVDDSSAADWVVTITANAREHNRMDYGTSSAYFAYVDAVVSVMKTATSQVICEDEISVKGSHTRSYNEAARDAYKSVGEKIVSLLGGYIK